MAAYVKFNSWAEYLTEGANCGSDVFKVAFVATASGVDAAADTVLADITTATTNMDTVTLTTTTSAQTSGVFKLDFSDLTMTATAGGTGPFRYVVIYDDTIAGDPLVCYFDYTGSATNITVAEGETFQIVFNAAGLFTVT